MPKPSRHGPALSRGQRHRDAYSVILLGEDDSDAAALIERAFRKANLANPVQHVDDGEDAVAWLILDEAPEVT